MIAARYRRRTECRICRAKAAAPFLSLGSIPLANAFPVSADDPQHDERYPLEVFLCETCSLVQLADVIDPELLFRSYPYLTGTSETVAEHQAEYAQTLAALLRLGPDDLVVELASNDGSLLERIRLYGARVLGVEPARNIAEVARARGVETHSIFFGSDAARMLRDAHGPARVVIANNVLAHIEDVVGFARGARELLAEEDSLLVVEVPYVGDLVERLEYDTIYHEHQCYFSVNALMSLCDAAGLRIVRLDRVPIHGGSLRMYASASGVPGAHAARVIELARREVALGLAARGRYERFADSVARSARSLVDLLTRLAAQGHSLAGYGAPAKGTTLLGYCGINASLIPYTVDRSPLKVGKSYAGARIPVFSVSTLAERRPDFALLFAWNFAEEIRRQQAGYLNAGGRFIVPIPEPAIS